ncbi:SurA N-terminal domain-containing protein [Methylacidimicrobium sp. B4]|uniref:peptidylprolyl isomerase n=1 Tax=Methylacidimicrobium sp. B4 TaxID=2796139 RepID=UPI001A8F17A9|nr:SurA N-terminal domain-containing protein [Methylacidimicrobium sp. B4]QSR84453.1 SurA N-terminal domain-containing protein [Methylacidimicrobium sp. B4]
MLKLFRSHSGFLVLILGLIGLSFLLFYNVPALSRLRGGALGKIAGEGVTLETFRLSRQAAEMELALFSGGRVPRRGGMDRLLNEIAWGRLVFLAEAKRLHCVVPDDVVVRAIEALPFLQKDGQYSEELYNQFVNGFLGGHGIKGERFVEIVRESLLIDQVKLSLVAPIQVGPGEVERLYRSEFGPAKLTVVRLSLEQFLPSVTVTPEQVDAELRLHGSDPSLRIPEQRKIAFVEFALPPEQSKLPEKEKKEAEEKLLQRAEDFAVTVSREVAKKKAFWEKAQQQGLAVQEIGSVSEENPPDLPGGEGPALAEAAFALSEENPISDPIRTPGGFRVLVLTEVEPSRSRPQAEIREILQRRLAERLAFGKLLEQGKETAQSLRKELAAGKSFADLVRERKLAAESLTHFVPAEPSKELRDGAEIALVSHLLDPGDLSPFTPVPGGGILVYLESRELPAVPESKELRHQIEEGLRESREQEFLEEWLTEENRKPGYQLPKSLASMGQEEP